MTCPPFDTPRGIEVLTRLIMSATCAACLMWSSLAAADQDSDYADKIKPLLRTRCFTCHGALKQEAGLRLDTVEAMNNGGVITPGDASSSLILQRVTATDVAERMPPEHEGEPLSHEQVQLLTDWINRGAPAPAGEKPEPDPRDHWSFQPITRPAIPALPPHKAAWAINPIDAFLAHRHEQLGLEPQKEAPRTILLRRLYIDLIGIPPTAEEIAAVERDTSSDWYTKTVERLLDDPRHGERWARHWMDVWRYSDWWGLGDQLRNSQKHIWHWRDWIVESLNDDMGYDEMVRLMLAADELHPGDLDKLRATGYLARNWFLFNRTQWMEETVEHVGKGLLGLTFNCAKCHDHKYDPIAQTDFYKLQAFFEPYHVRLDVVPGQPDLERDGIPIAYDGWLDRPTYLLVRGQEGQPDKSTVIAPGVPDVLNFAPLDIQPVSLPAEFWQPARRPWVIEAHIAAAKAVVAQRQAALDELMQQTDADDAENEAAKGTATETAADAQAAAAAAKALAVAERTSAEMQLAAATAVLASVTQRAAAMRAAWAAEDNRATDQQHAVQQTANEQREAAIKAERQAALAKAQQRAAECELRLLRAEPDKKASVEAELASAREEVTKATAQVEAPIAAEDAFEPLTGARWTATRFLDSTKDDPTVAFPPQSTGRRTALARWITDPRNPLTARVAANQLWMRHMGTPLVATVFDFGRNGTPPTHPELLDWLAAELISSGWSMKHMHRLIVNSAAYRMSCSAAGCETSAAKDPDNVHWWRRNPIRVESQVVRDAILALAGRLDLQRGGPSVPPAEQADSRRRSLYFFHSDIERNLLLTTFDEAMVKECYQREESVVPQQALALLNSRFVLDASPHIAARLQQSLAAPPADDAAFVRQAFVYLLGFAPSESELSAGREALAAWTAIAARDKDNTHDGNASHDSTMPPDNILSHDIQLSHAAATARTRFIWALLNHNDFVTLR